MGGGDVLDAAGEALPEVEAVADLHGVGCAGGDALPVGEGAVAAGDLDTWVLAEPVAELFRVAPFPECEREPGGGVDQEGAVGIAVEREVIHPQHPGCLQWWKWHTHQLGQDRAPRERDVQDPQHPGTAPAGQHHTDGLYQALQLWSAPLVAHGQPRHLLGEGHLRAGRVLAVQAAYGQVDAQRSASKSDVGEAPYIAAVAPHAELAASRTSRRNTGSRAGADRHDSIKDSGRDHQHIGQLW